MHACLMHKGMSVTFQKFGSLVCSWATNNTFTISDSVMRYSLFGNVSHAETDPGILNVSVSISIAHQLIDTSKFNVCHFYKRYILLDKNFFPSQIWASSMNSCCANYLH